ncbi:MAG: nicotinate (nicotinamide) nucleotide adenylyltransferase [Muribaculaceae bacterium]|nr:nicotinate (nicotinamide) nucleotide adenylyltransferase [Muribaculaceae bacterium]
MKVGIFGGSFDPIHEGHVNLAKYVIEHTDIDEVWLMVSPLNPLKPQGYIATDEQRLEMARLAVDGIPYIRVSDFEFHLPIPSYTYKTLTELHKTYPGIDFSLIIGGDNWASFDRWRNPGEILSQFGVIVYPRPGQSIESPKFKIGSAQAKASQNSRFKILSAAPQMPVSSTQIRQMIKSSPLKSDTSLEDSLNPSVRSYIRSHHLYT